MAHTVRVWDLPTRLFHWSLAICVVALVITGNVGGNAMVWHFRVGYCTGGLLLFRLVWGMIGGHWSRFVNFIYAPASVLAYLRGQAKPEHLVGHNPMGAFSVFGLLGFLLMQVGTGLFSDDEIAAAGPLTRFISSELVSQISAYHTEVGKLVLIVLIVLHVAAIVFYRVKKKENLVQAMVSGDKQLGEAHPSSRDTLATRMLSLTVLAGCAALVAYVVNLGA